MKHLSFGKVFVDIKSPSKAEVLVPAQPPFLVWWPLSWFVPYLLSVAQWVFNLLS